MIGCNAQIPQAWITVASTIYPTWIAAVSTAIVALLGLGVTVHWWFRRRVLRGSAAAIIALLGESSCQIMSPHGTSAAGRLSSRYKSTYISVGSERYVLCAHDLDRLREQGYVIRAEGGGSYRLSRLGQMLMARLDNAGLLARGVARARHHLPRCAGGFWFRCRCETYRYRVAGRCTPLPFFVGRVLARRPATRGGQADTPGGATG